MKGRRSKASRQQPGGYINSKDLDSKDPIAPQPTSPDITTYSKGIFPKRKERINLEWRISTDNKQVLVIDDHYDSAFTVKSCLESYCREGDSEGLKSKLDFHPIQVTVYADPLLALMEFKPNCYDLLLVDIDMPSMSGYELVEKIVKRDPNIKICFMSAGEINYEAIMEIRHSSRSFGCFIRKPASSTYLINRVLQELY